MKKPKELTRSQREILQKRYMKANDYLFVKDLGSYIKVITRASVGTNAPRHRIVAK